LTSYVALRQGSPTRRGVNQKNKTTRQGRTDSGSTRAQCGRILVPRYDLDGTAPSSCSMFATRKIELSKGSSGSARFFTSGECGEKRFEMAGFPANRPELKPQDPFPYGRGDNPQPGAPRVPSDRDFVRTSRQHQTGVFLATRVQCHHPRNPGWDRPTSPVRNCRPRPLNTYGSVFDKTGTIYHSSQYYGQVFRQT